MIRRADCDSRWASAAASRRSTRIAPMRVIFSVAPECPPADPPGRLQSPEARRGNRGLRSQPLCPSGSTEQRAGTRCPQGAHHPSLNTIHHSPSSNAPFHHTSSTPLPRRHGHPGPAPLTPARLPGGRTRGAADDILHPTPRSPQRAAQELHAQGGRRRRWRQLLRLSHSSQHRCAGPPAHLQPCLHPCRSRTLRAGPRCCPRGSARRTTLVSRFGSGTWGMRASAPPPPCAWTPPAASRVRWLRRRQGKGWHVSACMPDIAPQLARTAALLTPRMLAPLLAQAPSTAWWAAPTAHGTTTTCSSAPPPWTAPS